MGIEKLERVSIIGVLGREELLCNASRVLFFNLEILMIV